MSVRENLSVPRRKLTASLELDADSCGLESEGSDLETLIPPGATVFEDLEATFAPDGCVEVETFCG
jgi:hypothetical protein